MQIYNLLLKKFDPRIVSGYFIHYVVNSKGYKFYCHYHTPKIIEARNVKFFENYELSGSGFPYKKQYEKIRDQIVQPTKDVELIIMQPI